jgi:uncharacterized membrane protein YdcZ (DUF606 family)
MNDPEAGSKDGARGWLRQQARSSLPWWVWLVTAFGGVAVVTNLMFAGQPYGLGDYVWAVLAVIGAIGGVALALFNRSEQRRAPDR